MFRFYKTKLLKSLINNIFLFGFFCEVVMHMLKTIAFVMNRAINVYSNSMKQMLYIVRDKLSTAKPQENRLAADHNSLIIDIFIYGLRTSYYFQILIFFQF